MGGAVFPPCYLPGAKLWWTTFCQTSPPWPAHLGWPHRSWLSFIELDKAVVLVWLDWLVFCDYGFSVSAFWCPLATPTILLGFHLPWAWGISSRLLQQSAAAAPYLGWGVFPHHCPSWPRTWNSSSRTFLCLCSHCFLYVGLLLSVTTPDLQVS